MDRNEQLALAHRLAKASAAKGSEGFDSRRGEFMTEASKLIHVGGKEASRIYEAYRPEA